VGLGGRQVQGGGGGSYAPTVGEACIEQGSVIDQLRPVVIKRDDFYTQG